MDDDDLVILMSDHGHQPVTRSLSMNKILEHEGFLRFGAGSKLVNLLSWGRVRAVARVLYDKLGLHGRVAVPTPPLDWGRTRAYTSVVSTGEGVSVNLVGREPNGTVERADYERVRDEVAASLLEFEDPETGARPIAHVARKEEVLSRTVPRPGARPSPPAGSSLQPCARPAHGRAGRLALRRPPPRGHLRLRGAGDRKREGAEISLADFAEQIARAVGLEPDAEWSSAPAAEPVGAYSAEEERQVEERLRGLGYLE